MKNANHATLDIIIASEPHFLTVSDPRNCDQKK